MVKKIPIISVKIEALSMFLQGVKEIEIARQLNKSRHTITNWKKKYNWDEHFIKLEEETRSKTFDNNEKRKDKLSKIYKAIQMIFVRDLQEGNVKISAMDAIRAIEAEIRLYGLDAQRVETTVEGPVDWIRELKEQKAEEDKVDCGEK